MTVDFSDLALERSLPLHLLFDVHLHLLSLSRRLLRRFLLRRRKRLWGVVEDLQVQKHDVGGAHVAPPVLEDDVGDDDLVVQPVERRRRRCAVHARGYRQLLILLLAAGVGFSEAAANAESGGSVVALFSLHVEFEAGILLRRRIP